MDPTYRITVTATEIKTLRMALYEARAALRARDEETPRTAAELSRINYLLRTLQRDEG